MTLRGTVTQGQIVLDQPSGLPEGTRVEISITPLNPAPDVSGPTLAERLLNHAGRVNDLPADMAERHDHYIHGTPRR